MDNGPRRQSSNGLIHWSPTPSWLILRTVWRGDCGDGIPLAFRDVVHPFDLEVLPTRDLDCGPWQRALVGPNLSEWKLRVQLDQCGAHPDAQGVLLVPCHLWMQGRRQPEAVFEFAKYSWST